MSCSECFTGAIHQGKLLGSEESIAGIKTYVARPTSNSASNSKIIFITDAFGFNLINSKLLADQYATKIGCTVLVPDIIPGGGVPVDTLTLMESVGKPVGWFDIRGQIQRIFSFVRMMSIVIPFAIRTRNAFPGVLAYARAVRATLSPGGRLGAAGFCWGGLQTVKLSQEPSIKGGDKQLLDAHFTAHPAGLKVPDDYLKAAKAFHVPISIAVGDEDRFLSKSDVETIEAEFRQEFGSLENDFEAVVYPSCGHGFAVRAEPSKVVENDAANKAALQAIEWFKRHLN
ncbi:unnamed protein product [Clonostachys chloroleuca]|uniref:Dienelactone hydrolase domain-containing protein n=1 Tax=Clonostachys chloroleuca TaxID=1926264 RepID=A0AA35LPX8_9HYPO|nr:unnamed protein product [Clonostachys chloroleuca]